MHDSHSAAADDALKIPAEGEGGLFRQSWYPICLSSEVASGQVIGRPFLDGRVVVFRTEQGDAHVVSAYCPHLGADLAVGTVRGSNVQCAFHHWQYDCTGTCVKTGIGDPPPRAARLFKFPTIERWGIVWAFNGEAPLFELPQLPYPDEQLEIRAYKWPKPFACDPWVFAANTPDMQHIKVVHKVQFSVPDPHDLVEWDPWGLQYTVKGIHQGGVEIDWRVGLRGTGFFWRHGTANGVWSAAVTGFGLPRPGEHQVYGAYIALKGPNAEQQLATLRALTERTIGEDEPLLSSIHYRHGYLTKSDRTLAKYFQLLRQYPRAHPSAAFIR
ncbi:MAG TPA: Rieske 2Fe-2S domain-containing protein [Steroidobacter sp.]|uniref:Rieske 2Fe-2S domain-containing protein n=1 Tax=Steroidobacter sp. TaxID=1978227 RepID=UPI002ED7747F